MNQHPQKANMLIAADEYLYDSNVGSDDSDFDVFTDVTKEAKQELSLLLNDWVEKLLNDWVEKHLSNENIYEPIGKSTTHTITQDDLGE